MASIVLRTKSRERFKNKKNKPFLLDKSLQFRKRENVINLVVEVSTNIEIPRVRMR